MLDEGVFGPNETGLTLVSSKRPSIGEPAVAEDAGMIKDPF